MRTNSVITGLVALAGGLNSLGAQPPDDGAVRTDVIVYGASPSGIMAAVTAARHGHAVALLEPDDHLGGVVSGGLVDTDIGDRKTVGGLADDFLKRVAQHYREAYGADSPQFAACKGGLKYEPHVAEGIFVQMVRQQPRITVWKRHRLRTIALDGGRIATLSADDLAEGCARTFTGGVFIDASYTGDMMAAARVPFRVGREGRQEHGELLAGIAAGPKALRGLGDHRTQAYNYRVSITSRTANRVLFPKPEHYDPEPWRASYGARIRRLGLERFADLYVNARGKAGPNDKFDTNWGDLIGGSEGYAEGDWETRSRIEARHRDFFLSLLYFLQNDPGLPAAFRDDARTWGLPKDEFADNGHFPHQLYVREARRMLGRFVLREQDLTQDRFKTDGVCSGSYGVDCHVVQRLLHEGRWVVDHTPHVAVAPYDVPYACLTPLEPGNLLVPVCLSTTHVAYCSVRMEPVFMMLGHAAGAAAHLAIAGGTTVQQVDVSELRRILLEEGAVLDAGYVPPVRIAWTPDHPKPGQVVSFRVEADELKDPLARVWWDFEGHGAVSAHGREAEHAFSQDKVYTVGLLAEDAAGRRRLVSAEVPVGAAIARDLTMDDFQADLFGRWDGSYPSRVIGPGARVPDVFTGPGVHYDVIRDGEKVAARARFQPSLARAGRYEVCLGCRPAKNQATNVLVTIRHAGGVTRQAVDQRAETTPFPFVRLGEFRFLAGEDDFVEVRNAGTDGRVALDGVRWVWRGD